MRLPRLSTFLILFLFLWPLNGAAQPTLRILTWSEDYIEIDPAIDGSLPIHKRSPTLMEFERKYGCRVVYDEYDAEDEMLKRIQNLPRYYDLIGTSTDIIAKLREAGRLAKINFEWVPNRRHIMPKYLSVPEDPQGEYFMPYLIGTTGLVYRRDLAGEEIHGWKAFFEPNPALKGKLACLNSHYSLYFAMLYLGLDPAKQNREDIKRAARLFLNLKTQGFLARISSDLALTGEELSQGKLAMAICYSGEALAMVKNDPHGRLRYVLPNEGAEYFIDCLSIPSDAPDKRLAHQFINFFHDPEINARNAISLNYATANAGALALIKTRNPEYFQNPNINLSSAAMDRLKIFSGSNEDLRRLWQKISN